MEGEDFEIDGDAPLAVAFKKRKLQTRSKRKKQAQAAAAHGGEGLQAPPTVAEDPGEAPSGIKVSLFDYSVENHFKAVETIAKLCGQPETPDLDPAEINRFSSSIKFLREWRHFNYNPKTIRFACQNQSLNGKEVIGETSLPQFSAAAVPKKDTQNGEAMSIDNKDFVLHAGGSVWALDWCPRVDQPSSCDMAMEFVAVSTHPPNSSYHKIGVPLAGRGVIQIWCILSIVNEEHLPSQVQKKKRNYRKRERDHIKPPKPPKPRGRPRKKPVNESLDNLDSGTQCEALRIQDSEASSSLLSIVVGSNDDHGHVTETCSEDHLPLQVPEKQKQNSRKCQTDNAKSTKAKRPKGRRKKNPVNESFDGIDSSGEYVHEHVDAANPLTEKYIPIRSADGDKLLLTPSKRSTMKNKARTQGQPHTRGLRLATKDNKEDHSSMNPERSVEPESRKGRQRKKPAKFVDYEDYSSVQAIAIEYPEDPPPLLSAGVEDHVAPTGTGGNQETPNQKLTEDNLLISASVHERLEDEARTGGKANYLEPLLEVQHENTESRGENSQALAVYDPDSTRSSGNTTSISYSGMDNLRSSVPKDVALPRMMLCLAHNGKVAWDVKWQPSNSYNKHRMGYLAVILGNGALEVWEVPFPRTVGVIYPDYQMEGTDPRFVKLEPVFRCSKLKSGDRHSIPLTLEWSASFPHDMILAGCHDGVVAMWKFSASSSCKDTRPLLCFNADTVPIRSLAWAPAGSESEGANVIVTAGHKGIKFWDIRDPFRPLWDFNVVQRNIFSLDWQPDPRCIIVAFDDGTLRTLGLMKAAYDVSATGKPFVGTPQQGFVSYLCSSFAIWNVHVSRRTGMVAYCGADGNTLRFQLTTRAVEKDPLRNRAPHFLCGSLVEEQSTLVAITPESDTPFPMKKSMDEWADAPRTKRGFLSMSNQKKRAKEKMVKKQTSVEQPLALCLGNDPGSDYDSDPSAVQKHKWAHNPKTSTKSKLRTSEQALVCRNDGSETLQNEADGRSEVVNEIESWPPKLVAIHKVRWNLNKGSERWLCYGGAAGVLRCQEIDLSIS